MATKLKNVEICSEGRRKFLLLKGPWSQAAGELMQRENVTGIRLSAYAGWFQDTIDFLREMTFLESVDLWTPKVRDITPLYSLPKLHMLSLNGIRAKMEFDKIPTLEDLHLSQWGPNFKSIFSLERLKNLGIAYFSEPDLQDFAKIQSLENLGVSFSKIHSLKGIGRLQRLARLSMAKVDRLENLDGIENCKNLMLLWVEGAKLLSRIDALSGTLRLRTLNLSDCPRISTLLPIVGLPALEAVWFFGTTNISDGDFSPLKSLEKLKYAKFVDRPHYLHKNTDFPKSLPIFR